MTMPAERTTSLFDAGEFLQEILFLEPGYIIDEAIRKKAQRILRHYPPKSELDLLVQNVEKYCPRPMLCIQKNVDA